MKKNINKAPKKKSKVRRSKLFWWGASLYDVGNRDAVQETLFRLGSTGLVEEASHLTAYFEPVKYPQAGKLAEV
ncbi:hypothetical protein JNL27_12240, partial [bacterium]|nr:hypothetical protein [bacterium]